MVLQVLRRPLHVHPAAHGPRKPAHQVSLRLVKGLQSARRSAASKLFAPSWPVLATTVCHLDCPPACLHARLPVPTCLPDHMTTCPPAPTCASACLQPDHGVDGAAQPDGGEPGHAVRCVARGLGGNCPRLLHKPLRVSGAAVVHVWSQGAGEAGRGCMLLALALCSCPTAALLPSSDSCPPTPLAQATGCSPSDLHILPVPPTHTPPPPPGG